MRSITKQSGGAGRVRPGGPNRFSDALRELRPAQCIALANEVHRALAKRLDHDLLLLAARHDDSWHALLVTIEIGDDVRRRVRRNSEP